MLMAISRGDLPPLSWPTGQWTRERSSPLPSRLFRTPANPELSSLKMLWSAFH